MIVADANLLIYLVCATPRTDLARAVYAYDPAWTAPRLWEAEVLNGLLVMHRAGLIGLAEAVQAWRNAAVATTSAPHAGDPARILAMATETGLSAYDACYVTLARSLGVCLVTEDKRILRSCPDVARSLKAFLGLPEEPPGAPGPRSP